MSTHKLTEKDLEVCDQVIGPDEANEHLQPRISVHPVEGGYRASMSLALKIHRGGGPCGYVVRYFSGPVSATPKEACRGLWEKFPSEA